MMTEPSNGITLPLWKMYVDGSEPVFYIDPITTDNIRCSIVTLEHNASSTVNVTITNAGKIEFKTRELPPQGDKVYFVKVTAKDISG